MQLGSGYVIIYRATAIIINPTRKNIIRYGLAVVLAISVGLNLASDILRDMSVIDGICVPVFVSFVRSCLSSVEESIV
jgi:hypothetical protein